MLCKSGNNFSMLQRRETGLAEQNQRHGQYEPWRKCIMHPSSLRPRNSQPRVKSFRIRHMTGISKSISPTQNTGHSLCDTLSDNRKSTEIHRHTTTTFAQDYIDITIHTLRTLKLYCKPVSDIMFHARITYTIVHPICHLFLFHFNTYTSVFKCGTSIGYCRRGVGYRQATTIYAGLVIMSAGPAYRRCWKSSSAPCRMRIAGSYMTGLVAAPAGPACLSSWNTYQHIQRYYNYTRGNDKFSWHSNGAGEGWRLPGNRILVSASGQHAPASLSGKTSCNCITKYGRRIDIKQWLFSPWEHNCSISKITIVWSDIYKRDPTLQHFLGHNYPWTTCTHSSS